MEEFDRISRENPELNNAKQLTQLGDALTKDQKYEEAFHYYKEATESDPMNAEAWNGLGVSCVAIEKTAEAAKNFHRAIQLNPKLYSAFLNLGLLYSRANRWEEAMNCHKRVLELYPNHFRAHFCLGSIYSKRKERERALFHYERAAQINPEHPGVQHMISSLKGENVVKAPPKYVENLFDFYAKTFDSHLTKDLNYRVPEILAREIRSVEEGHFENVLDLGCGTGLMADALENSFERITGIDLSKNMLDQANDKKKYNLLYHGDIAEFLKSRNESYDLVVAADVFVYYGDLREVFKLITERLRPGGLFAFSVEALESGEFKLLESGRFAHSAEYIHEVSRDLVLKKQIDSIQLRNEGDKILMGRVFVVEKVLRDERP